MENVVKEESKKKNLIIGVLIVLLLIAVGFICYEQFLKKDNDTNKIEEKDSTEIVDTNKSELDNAILFAKKDGTKLVAITSDGKEISIYDFSHGVNVNGSSVVVDPSRDSGFYFDYDQDEKVLYLFLQGSNDDKYLAVIDLKNGKGNYKPEIITKVELSDSELSGDNAYGGNAYIAKIGNTIYFSNTTLYKYDIQSKKYEKTDIKSNGRTMWLLKNKSNLIYNDNMDIYILDTITNKSTKILSDGSQAYIYNGKLVYYYDGNSKTAGKLNEDTYESYYLYDFNTSKKEKITNYIGIGQVDKEYIIPYGDTMYSFKGLKLYGYNGNKIEEKYSFTCNDFTGIIDKCTNEKLGSINNFVKISNDSMLITFGDDYEGELYNVEFNLNTKKTMSVSNRETNQYSSEYYLR